MHMVLELNQPIRHLRHQLDFSPEDFNNITKLVITAWHTYGVPRLHGLSDEEFNKICNAIKYMPNLEKVDLSDCQLYLLNHQRLQALIEAILTRHTPLKKLSLGDMGGQHWKNEAWQVLLKFLKACCPFLNSLNLSGDAINTFWKISTNTTKFKQLNDALAENKLSKLGLKRACFEAWSDYIDDGQGLQMFFEFIRRSALQKLSLTQTNIGRLTAITMKRLFVAIKHARVTVLNITENGFYYPSEGRYDVIEEHNDTFDALCQGLSACNHLKKLIITEEEFTSEELEKLNQISEQRMQKYNDQKRELKAILYSIKKGQLVSPLPLELLNTISAFSGGLTITTDHNGNQQLKKTTELLTISRKPRVSW
ncbi:MAG: hypothetical protein ABSA84_02785 [Gammaproteobacteria bacterium]